MLFSFDNCVTHAATLLQVKSSVSVSTFENKKQDFLSKVKAVVLSDSSLPLKRVLDQLESWEKEGLITESDRLSISDPFVSAHLERSWNDHLPPSQLASHNREVSAKEQSQGTAPVLQPSQTSTALPAVKVRRRSHALFACLVCLHYMCRPV